jgi:ABC-2 type transport system ATP-binding protein
MKRRLDLALALVHSPRVLFLDEPTTGLDPQSRADLWREVSRLAREDGVTVFLTTQYLEEADVLADHVGIINHGRIVAEGTPEGLKADIGRPTLEVVPADRSERQRFAETLARYGPPASTTKPHAVAVLLDNGADALASVIRGIDAEALRMDSLQVHKPTLDDVFLAKTGQSLAQQDESAAAPAEDESAQPTQARA